MKNLLLGLFIGILLTLTTVVIYRNRQQLGINIDVVPTPTSEPTVVVTATPSPIVDANLPTPKPDQLLLKEALAQKYKLSVSDVSLIIGEITPNRASGTVSFKGEGGWFLAAKDNDQWQIVADGNGTVSCETVTKYNFPRTMVPECLDKNGNLVKL